MNCFGKVAAMSLFGMLFFGVDATAVKAPTLPQAYEMLFAKGQKVNEQQLPAHLDSISFEGCDPEEADDIIDKASGHVELQGIKVIVQFVDHVLQHVHGSTISIHNAMGLLKLAVLLGDKSCEDTIHHWVDDGKVVGKTVAAADTHE